jgi:hypothetical protein
MPDIFEGVDTLIDRALRVTDVGNSTEKRYATKTSALRLQQKPYGFDASDLCKTILGKIEANWRNGLAEVDRFGSRENWRLEKQLYISDRNQSPEKQLEKLIVNELGADWVNQVPTASGLINSTANKHCNIDLVHILSAAEYELIELKFGSDYPLSAAFELLKYGIIYLFSRKVAQQLGYSREEKPLLFADRIHLIVLAPYQYYSGYNVRWLEAELSRGLAMKLIEGAPAVDFHFEHFRVVDGENDVADIVASRKKMYSA